MESTKTTKITISLSRQEKEILEKAHITLRALRDEVERDLNIEEADEVILADSTSEALDDLSCMLEDVRGLY